MTVNWQQEVDQRKEALLDDLVELLKVKSEREDDKITADAPFGPGPRDALLHMLSYGERDGFVVKNVDNYAGHIEYGEGEEILGIFGHMDVVPAGDGWDTDPYVPVIKDNKIYARGSSDDKGPSMAAYYGLKIIKELGLPVSKKIRFVVGSDEESTWKDMDYYFEHEEMPDFGFAPDAEFPIINGEKGNISVAPQFASTNGGSYELKTFKAGLRPNMVPQDVTAVVTAPSVEKAESLKEAYHAYLEKSGVSGTAELNDTVVSFKLIGKSAHGASPQSGVNAATYLATFLNEFDFGGGAKNYLTVAAHIHLDVYVEKLGVAYEDEKMGKLTMNAGLFEFVAGEEGAYINFNFRYPQGTGKEQLAAGITDSIGQYVTTLKVDEKHSGPHYVPVEDPLVATLLAVYEEHTGEKGYEQIIGGGTYGRLLKRGVAFGAMFPGFTDTMHQANEFMSLDDLFRAAVIYADAIYRLAK
ncbi:MAG: dipeptidase PepV [Enterococcus aquimarinus]